MPRTSVAIKRSEMQRYCYDADVSAWETAQMEELRKQFDAAMFDIYRRAKDEAGYTATIFLRMVADRGGLATAKYLINSAKPSDGYTHLYERGRLDLTVEAMIVKIEKWHPLFTSGEIGKARKRLADYGYRS
jgi:hypothetical protein